MTWTNRHRARFHSHFYSSFSSFSLFRLQRLARNAATTMFAVRILAAEPCALKKERSFRRGNVVLPVVDFQQAIPDVVGNLACREKSFVARVPGHKNHCAI